MVVIVDNGAIVKKFGNTASAVGYAESMMKKKHNVWVLETRIAVKYELM